MHRVGAGGGQVRLIRKGEVKETLKLVSMKSWTQHERHLRRGTMWSFYWEANKVKIVLNLRRYRVSRAKWERDWAAFITRSWNESESVTVSPWLSG